MKEFWLFLKWQWNKFEFWQKCWIGSFVFFGAGLVSDPPASTYLFMVPTFIIFGFMFKWALWDGTRAAWKNYKKEKSELFETIKEGK